MSHTATDLPHSQAGPPAATTADGDAAGRLCLDPLRLVDGAVVAIGLAYALAALVGLPLFADGAHYLFRLRMDGLPYVPDLRLAAVPMQLPAWLASRLGADVLATRHLFAFGETLVPAASIAGCWLVVRRRAPWLMLFPALALLLNQVNFSGVSELLAMQYLAWPLVLAMALHAGRPWVQRYAAIAGPLLLVQHPLAFAPAFGLAALALIVAWMRAGSRRTWLRLALWLAACGAARAIWSSVGLSAHYEQTMLSADGAAFYFLPVTPGQTLLLGAVTVLGLAWTGRLLHRGRALPSVESAGGPRLLLWLTVLALPPLVLLLGHEMAWGQGVRLKVGLTVVASFVLMAAAGLAGVRARPDRSPSPVAGLRGTLAPTLVALAGIAALLLVKSAAWWTATRGLQNIVADTPAACVPLSRQTPYGLQWPWMVIVDDWNAPMNALIFRPRLRDPATRELVPIALLLPDDGCDRLAEEPVVYPTPWLSVSWERLDERFGPLRRPGP